jgi:hypothetical protein
MPTLLQYHSEQGSILVEVDPQVMPPDANKPLRAGAAEVAGAVIKAAGLTFDAALASVRVIANGFLAQTENLTARPSEIELSFGLDVAGEAGVFGVAKGSTKSAFEVKIKWSGDTLTKSEESENALNMIDQ